MLQVISTAHLRAVLSHCLGTKVQSLFYLLPDTGTTYGTAMTALVNFFVPKNNIIAECHAFYKRAQMSNETVLPDITVLHELTHAKSL